MPLPRFVLVTSITPGPLFSRGKYARIGLLELHPDCASVPKRIDTRLKGVKALVRTWECLYKGTTKRCQYAKALEVAETECARLNTSASAELERSRAEDLEERERNALLEDSVRAKFSDHLD